MESPKSFSSATSFDPRAAIRTAAQDLDLREVLQAGPDILLSVGASQVACLQQLSVATVFDLATSQIFGNAADLDDAGADEGNLYRRSGLLSTDMLAAPQPGTPVEELRTRPISILAGIGPELAPGVTDALGVGTVQELARLPAYRAAKAILASVFFPESLASYDAEAPADLLPRNGDFPTERVTYTTQLFDGVAGKPPEIDALGDAFHPLDINADTSGDWGFQKIGFGTLLTFTQSWYQEGVTLGQLLHCTALAPGESTRMAVVDWSRRSRAGETATEQQTERLTNDTEQNRAINEVTSAVTREAQGGFAGTHQTASSQQHSVSTAGPQGGGSGGLVGAVSGVVGGAIGALEDVADAIFDW